MNQSQNAFNDWLSHSAAGQYASRWQQQHYDKAVADFFGYYALKIGATPIDALQASRIQHRWCISDSHAPNTSEQLCAAPEALPFGPEQFDLLVMPHGLELSHQPHAALREACRVLRPEGRLVISGFNPVRLAGKLRPALSLQQLGKPIGLLRLRDWLQLLDLEVQDTVFGCFLPGFEQPQWYARLAWLDKLAARPMPFLGGMYCLVATKKVHSAHILTPNWKHTQRQEQKNAVAVKRSQGCQRQ